MNLDVLQMPGWGVVSNQRVEVPGGPATRLLVIAPTKVAVPQSCPKCKGTRMVASGQRAYQAVDAPLWGDQVQLTVMQPRFRCEALADGRRCGHVALHPLPDEVSEGRTFTTRCAELIHREQAGFRPVRQIATTLGAAEASVRGYIKRTRTAKAPVELPVPKYLGIDEVELRNLADEDEPFKRRKRAVFTDLERGQIIALLDDNDLQTVGTELARLAVQGSRTNCHIRGVAVDFHLPYRRAVEERLGKGMPVVIDRFHVEHRLHRALEAVRVRDLKDKERPRPGFLQKDEVRMLATMLWSKKAPSQPNKGRLFSQYLDHYPDTAAAYSAKQAFKAMWGQRCSSEQALANFKVWTASIPDNIKEDFEYFTKFINKHEKPVFRYFDLSISNSLGENRNGLIRSVMRTGKRLHLTTLRGKLLDHAEIAYQRPQTHFICDGCGERTPERSGKVGPVPHHDGGERWLCSACEADPKRVSPRPDRTPTRRRRRSTPDLPQAVLAFSERPLAMDTATAGS